jgi:hypothetical protein
MPSESRPMGLLAIGGDNGKKLKKKKKQFIRNKSQHTG